MPDGLRGRIDGVRIGGSPIVGLQQASERNEEAEICCQNWRKPDCGIATQEYELLAANTTESELAEARLWDCNQVKPALLHRVLRVRIGGSPIVGLQPMGGIGIISRCNVRIGGSPIVGLQLLMMGQVVRLLESQNWRKPDCGIATLHLLKHLAHIHCQNWRKPDCGIATGERNERVSRGRGVRIGGSPIVGLQPLCPLPGPRPRRRSELAEARLWDCNLCRVRLPLLGERVRIGGSPIVGLQLCRLLLAHCCRLEVRIGGSPIVGLQH